MTFRVVFTVGVTLQKTRGRSVLINENVILRVLSQEHVDQP